MRSGLMDFVTERAEFQIKEVLILVLSVPALGKLAELLENLKQQIEQQQTEQQKQ